MCPAGCKVIIRRCGTVFIVNVHDTNFGLEGKSFIFKRVLAVDQQGTVHTTGAIKGRGGTGKQFHAFHIQFRNTYDGAY